MKITWRFAAITVLLVLVSRAEAATISFSNDLTTVLVDGNSVASGQAESVLYDAGTYHLWYRDSAAPGLGVISHASSTDGVNFTTSGQLTFGTDPFPTGTPPYLYYENVSKVGGEYKLIHWTYNGGEGDYPSYQYGPSVSNVGTDPTNTVLTHQGPAPPATGDTSGSSGITGGYYYGFSNADTLFRGAYTDGSPPTIGSQSAVLDVGPLLTSIGDTGGYVNNHGDVVELGDGDLGVFFTVRYSSGVRFNQQVYFARSTDGGATWSTPSGLFSSPTLEGGSFGGNFAHPDYVSVGGGGALYISTQNAAGDYILATTSVVPEPASMVLMLGAIVSLLLWRRSR